MVSFEIPFARILLGDGEIEHSRELLREESYEVDNAVRGGASKLLKYDNLADQETN